MNNLVIAFHENYIKIINTTIQNLNETLFPNLDIGMLSKLYRIAFAELTSSPTLFHENFLKELYLEQLRKPQLRAVILQYMTDTSLPVYNEYRRDEGLSDDVDLLKIGAWAIRTAHSDNDKDLFSVHQILDAAHRELFSPIPAVRDACEPSQLFSGTVRNEDIQPLFKDKAPGIITREAILTVYRINHQASKLEKSFVDKDRNAALEVFHTQLADMRLTNCLSVSRIAALLEVSNKYINIHTNPKFDEKVGKTNTKTWKKTVKDARTQGLNIIKQEVEAAKVRGNASDRSIEELEYFRNHSLFSQHRSNYKIFGAFGLTQAQVEIDSMIGTLKQLKHSR